MTNERERMAVLTITAVLGIVLAKLKESSCFDQFKESTLKAAKEMMDEIDPYIKELIQNENT